MLNFVENALTKNNLQPDLRTIYYEKGVIKTLNELNKAKVAVIGLGKMGILHSTILNMLKPGIIKALVDRSRVIAIGFSRMVKNIRFYRDASKMVLKEIPDAVYITTPTNSHYSLLSLALSHGVKAIFVEKPPTTNSSQLKNLIKNARDETITMVGFQKKYSLTFRHAKQLLEMDMLGDVDEVYGYIKSGDVCSPTERFKPVGRGVLLDLGIHLIDLLLWMFGDMKVKYASYRTFYSELDDQYTVILHTKKGSFEVKIDATWSDPNFRIPETYIEVRGNKGVLKVTEDYLELNTNSNRISFYKPHYYKGIPPVNVADPEYTIEDMHFLLCLTQGLKPLTNLNNTLKTMELIDQVYNLSQKYD